MLRAVLFVFVLFFGNVFFAMSPVMGANAPGSAPAQLQNSTFPRQTEDVNIDELYRYIYRYVPGVSEYNVSTKSVIRPAIPLRFNNDINSVRNRVECSEIRRGVYKLAQVNIIASGNIKSLSERFLEKVEFSFNVNCNNDEKIKNISAIRSLVYKIASNPVGRALLQRIVDGLGRIQNGKVAVIFGGEYGYTCHKAQNARDNQIYAITLPLIRFAGTKAIRQDNDDKTNIYGCEINNAGGLTLKKLKRPYYIGLVHELIHMMHELEQKLHSGVFSGYFSGQYSGPTIANRQRVWGAGDDLHAIWGIYEDDFGNFEYEIVSELTFRIEDKIPIRMFCPQDKLVKREMNPVINPNTRLRRQNSQCPVNWISLVPSEEGTELSRIAHKGFDKKIDYYGILQRLLTKLGRQPVITVAN